ncbi:Fat storage-inducing transmembrane protein 1 [Sciurus carolinensis]|nr:Fat storage-inducing transmembrane protein 1 [Sciurus carolinensis]
MERGPVVGAGLGAGARIRALLGCLVKVLLWVASALLYFGSEQAARLLGSPCLRRLYHAWLAAVVIFGPLLQFHVNSRTIFASHGNFFNIKFVNSAWGWTCTFLGGFVLLVVFLATRRVAVTARHLSRLVVGAAVWRGAGRAFLLIEDLTGSCFEPLPQGLLLHELPDRRSCLAAGHQWRGYTVSSHTFLLTFCCLLMAEEAAVFAKYLAHGLPAGAPLRLVFLLNVLLLGLWNFLLLCTVIYFHQYTHKVVGAAVGTFACTQEGRAGCKRVLLSLSLPCAHSWLLVRREAPRSAMATLRVQPEAQAKVDVFREDLCTKTENLLGSYFPKKISELDAFLKKEDKDEKKKGEDEDKGPPCGPVNCNEKIVVLLQRLKPEIKDVIEQLNLVTTWLQLQIPRIEDGNNFGVAVQEKVFELMTSLHTKLEGFHTQISKYFSERGDAVTKAAKQPHVGDYRQLVHELDEAEYRDIRLMVMEIRNAYAVLYDIILKNFEKLKKPRGETKGMIY